MAESSDKTWSAGEGNGKPLQFSCFENSMNSLKKQKDMTLKDGLPRSVGAQYANEEEWIHVYVWLSPFAVHLKLTQHC